GSAPACARRRSAYVRKWHNRCDRLAAGHRANEYARDERIRDGTRWPWRKLFRTLNAENGHVEPEVCESGTDRAPARRRQCDVWPCAAARGAAAPVQDPWQRMP